MRIVKTRDILASLKCRINKMQNTYTFGIHHNLSPVELFFFVAVDETLDELGISDVVGVAMVLSGQRFIPTRGKFAGAVKGTSLA